MTDSRMSVRKADTFGSLMRDPKTVATILRAFFPTWGHFFRAIATTALSLFIGATWWQTLHVLKHDFFKDLLEVTLLLAVLFIAEGLEIAYTILRDKYPEQLGEVDGRIFSDMKTRENLFYEAREWLVVLIIVALTLKTEFAKVYIPFFGLIPDFEVAGVVVQAHILFSILFTTVPLVWIAQGPAKEFARVYPLRMLIIASKTKVWLLVKVMGYLVNKSGLTGPSRAMGLGLVRAGASGSDLSLKSSDHGWFCESVKRLGTALHENSVTVNIDRDGSCRIRQRLLIYAVSPQTVFRHFLMLDSAAIGGSLKTNLLKGYHGPPISEKHNKVYDQLEAILKGESPAPEFEEVPEFCTPTLCESAEGRRAEFRAKTWYEVPLPGRSFVLLVECEGSWGPQAFRVVDGRGNSYTDSCDYPCQRYRLRISPDPVIRMHFTNVTAEATFMGNFHRGEADRLRFAKEASVTELGCLLKYPLPGASYRYTWDVVVPPIQNAEQ